MFKLEDDKILWEGRVVATFVDGLPATLRDSVESALECYEKDSVSREEHDAVIEELSYHKTKYKNLKNKLTELAASY